MASKAPALIKCPDCGQERTVTYSMGWNIRKGSNTGRCYSCAAKLKPHKFKGAERGDKNIKWKGDEVGIDGLHTWVHRELGQPLICWECGKNSGTTHNFHWANLSHKYMRDLSDWARLCVSCHKKYDLGLLELELSYGTTS